MFSFSVQRPSETYLILRRTDRDKINNVFWSSCEAPVILGQILMTLDISQEIFETYSKMNFISIRPVGEELFHANGRKDRRTDRYNNINIYLLQLDCHPVAVVILHVNKT